MFGAEFAESSIKQFPSLYAVPLSIRYIAASPHEDAPDRCHHEPEEDVDDEDVDDVDVNDSEQLASIKNARTTKAATGNNRILRIMIIAFC
ncbi:MAG: hypothetical protein M1455_10205 [Actinobacteria bacterium]|nr:hypothetical protein [Actinomycetota bacterium]